MTSSGFLSTFASAAFVFLYICSLQHNQVVAASLPPLHEDIPKLTGLQESCKVESGVSDAVFSAALMNKMDVNDKNLQCYTKCMFTGMGTMDESGKMSLEKFIDQLSPESKKIRGTNMLACQKEIDDNDLCVKGMKLYECFQKKGGSYFQFI